MKTIKFLSLNPLAKLPIAHGDKSVGLDLTTVTRGFVDNVASKFDTGVVLHPDSEPEVSAMFVSLRSGFADVNSVWMVNSPGIIESNFRGFVVGRRLLGICLSLVSFTPVSIRHGERIAQLTLWDSVGKLMIPNQDYRTEFGGYCNADVLEWEQKYKSRGGFGSTDVSK